MQPGRAAKPPQTFPAQTYPFVIPDTDRQKANSPKILRISAGFGAPIAKFFGIQETEWSAKNIGTDEAGKTNRQPSTTEHASANSAHDAYVKSLTDGWKDGQ